MTVEVGQEEQKNKETTWVPWGITTFGQLDSLKENESLIVEYNDLTYQFIQLSRNVANAPDITDKRKALLVLVDEYTNRVESLADNTLEKEMKRFGGKNLAKAEYAYAPTDDPADWKLRLTENGKVTKAQLGRVAASLSEGGFRGNTVIIPKTAIAAVKSRIRREYKKLGIPDSEVPESVKEINDFLLTKDAKTDQLRWFAIYSNNYLDDDKPKGEIIKEKAHRTFAYLTKEELVPYPELWHWHIPGTRWGQADWIEYQDGFSLASGLVDKGKEQEAYNLAAMENIRVSHGMPVFLYDPNDAQSIDFYISKEISPLPAHKAANPFTGFVMESDMDKGLSDEKKAHLKGLGHKEEDIAKIDLLLSNRQKTAEESGRISKEKEGVILNDTPPQETNEQQVNEGNLTVDQLVKEVADVITPIIEEIATLKKSLEGLTGLQAQINGLQERMDGVDAKAKSIVAETPRMSLSELIAQSAVGKQKAIVDAADPLAADKPKEVGLKSFTGISVLDRAIQTNLEYGRGGK